MAYYGCSNIERFTLGVTGPLDSPHEKNSKVFALCCEGGNIPGIPLGKTAEETLERFIGMRHRFVIRGGC